MIRFESLGQIPSPGKTPESGNPQFWSSLLESAKNIFKTPLVIQTGKYVVTTGPEGVSVTKGTAIKPPVEQVTKPAEATVGVNIFPLILIGLALGGIIYIISRKK